MRPRLETLRDFMAPGSGVPPVLAHRAHKILSERESLAVLGGRAQSEAAPPPAPEQAKQN